MNITLVIFELCNQKKHFEELIDMEKKDFYTPEEAAEMLNSNVQTIRRLIKLGELKAYYKLRKYYILHSDLINYIKR